MNTVRSSSGSFPGRKAVRNALVFLQLFCLHVLLLGCLVPGQGLADEALDEIMAGFDEPLEEKDTENGGDLDSILSGFDTSPEQPPQPAGELSSPAKWLDLFGSLSLKGSWNFAHHAPEAGNPDYRDLSELKLTGALGADLDIGSWRARISGHAFYDAAWSLKGREPYTGAFLDAYEQEAEADEIYIQGSLAKWLDLKVGRQVVVWGKADNVRVTDLLNPLDNRTPGIVDIKYRRLPVTMSKLDVYAGNWNLSTIVLHEIRFDKNPVFNGEFYPGDRPTPPQRTPTNFSLANQQFALALNGIFSGWDIAMYQAWVYDSRAHQIMDPETGAPVRVHGRVGMSGITTNVALGNWLIKGEGAWWRDLEYGAAPGETFDRIDLMAGLEYTGFSETVLSIEMVNRHILDYDRRLSSAPDFAQENLLQTALMLKRDFLNDTLQLKILCSIFGGHGEDGAFERIQLEYDVTDQITLTGGLVFYQDGDLVAFSDLGENDRIFLEFQYAF